MDCTKHQTRPPVSLCSHHFQYWYLLPSPSTGRQSFFGLTSFGPQDPVKDRVKTSHEYVFHTFPIEHYTDTFTKYTIGTPGRAH